jgi:putative CocE/NonD family hydrolase
MRRLSVLTSLVCVIWTDAAAKSPHIRWGVRIPTRDGVRLNAALFFPESRRGKVPVVLTITPYVVDRFHDVGTSFARHGFVFAAVDSRGRGNSGGRFAPFEGDGRDGRDVVRWLARQPYCDGRVVMWGGSYGGFNQWATLAAGPRALRAIAPVAAAYPQSNWETLQLPYEVRWQALVAGRTRNVKLFLDSKLWFARFRELHVSGRPLSDLPRIAGISVPTFQKWLRHPHPDAYWDRLAPRPRRLDVPVLTITGQYDDSQRQALRYHELHGGKRHYLLIGPWDHAGTRKPRRKFGGLSFARRSVVDMIKLHREWYDWALRRRARPPLLLKKRVAYFVAGAGEWRHADSLDKIPARPRRLYLDSDGKASDVFRSGQLRRKAPKGSRPPDSYLSDPRDVRYINNDRPDFWDRNTWVDQRIALGIQGNGLVYHSRPLERDTELLGRAKLKLWLAMDVPDTDLYVTLFEIRPDGSGVLLGETALRARYRESRRRPRLVPRNKVLSYSFTFPFMARRLARGSRLRLTVSPPRSVWFAKNYQGGGAVAFESKKNARVGRIKLFHDAGHPSHLELPLSSPLGLMEYR